MWSVLTAFCFLQCVDSVDSATGPKKGIRPAETCATRLTKCSLSKQTKTSEESKTSEREPAKWSFIHTRSGAAQHGTARRRRWIWCEKAAFHWHDTDTDILARILADTSDTRDFLKLFLWQAERGSCPTRRHPRDDHRPRGCRRECRCWCRCRGMRPQSGDACHRTVLCSAVPSRIRSQRRLFRFPGSPGKRN